jgi:hypothetical protein
MKRLQFRSPARALLVVCVAAAAGLALAQDKSVAVEPVPAFPAFTQWITSVVTVVSPATPASVHAVPVTASDTATGGADYQPLPVIVGLPELPLLGAGTAQAGKAWGQELNYQGVFMRQVVLDGKGAVRATRPMSTRPKAGERFKIRVTATFEAVADIDLVSGDTWSLRRVGQVYPPKGQSVHMRPGETVDLPLAPDEYFVMSPPAGERLVVSVRHVKALGAARSGQPAYRQDVKQGSQYLQLVPKGSFPAVEQLVTQAR